MAEIHRERVIWVVNDHEGEFTSWVNAIREFCGENNVPVKIEGFDDSASLESALMKTPAEERHVDLIIMDDDCGVGARGKRGTSIQNLMMQRTFPVINPRIDGNQAIIDWACSIPTIVMSADNSFHERSVEIGWKGEHMRTDNTCMTMFDPGQYKHYASNPDEHQRKLVNFKKFKDFLLSKLRDHSPDLPALP